jgi:hypothetical protein
MAGEITGVVERRLIAVTWTKIAMIGLHEAEALLTVVICNRILSLMPGAEVRTSTTHLPLHRWEKSRKRGPVN